jgi:hypothetical protein
MLTFLFIQSGLKVMVSAMPRLVMGAAWPRLLARFTTARRQGAPEKKFAC